MKVNEVNVSKHCLDMIYNNMIRKMYKYKLKANEISFHTPTNLANTEKPDNT